MRSTCALLYTVRQHSGSNSYAQLSLSVTWHRVSTAILQQRHRAFKALLKLDSPIASYSPYYVAHTDHTSFGWLANVAHSAGSLLVEFFTMRGQTHPATSWTTRRINLLGRRWALLVLQHEQDGREEKQSVCQLSTTHQDKVEQFQKNIHRSPIQFETCKNIRKFAIPFRTVQQTHVVD